MSHALEGKTGNKRKYKKTAIVAAVLVAAVIKPND